MPIEASPLRTSIAVAVGVGLLVAAMRLLGMLEPAELWAWDQRLRLDARAADRDVPIRLVLIGETEIRRFGHPLPDRVLARLLERVLRADPTAIGVDLYRDLPVPRAAEAKSPFEAPGFARLGALVRSDHRVVMATKFPDAQGGGVEAPPFLEGPHQAGAVDLVLDRDGTVRRALLYLWNAQGDAMEAMALQLAKRHLGRAGIAPAASTENADHVALGPTNLPPLLGDFGPYVRADAGGYQIPMDYRFGPHTFPRIALADILDDAVSDQQLSGAIVLIGTDAESVRDHFRTPLASDSVEGSVPGVAIHASVVEQLLRHAKGESPPITSSSTASTYAAIAVFALIGALLAALDSRGWLRALGGLGALAALALASVIGARHALWVPVLAPSLAGGLAASSAAWVIAAQERRGRRAVASLFSRFQGPAVARELWRQRAAFIGESGRPVSRRVTLTVLMSDIEGYTAASEKMEPQALLEWVNEYMNAMADLVEAHGGAVDDYAGDGIKANFGFPVPSEDEASIDADAIAAVRCALAMGERMEQLNTEWRGRDLPTGRCRIGLFTGPAVVGCIGGDRSLKFTSVGDTVNIAARLEGFDKEGFSRAEAASDWRVLIGEETRRRIRDAFDIESLGAHPLKGKDEPVPIYRVRNSRPAARGPTVPSDD